MLDNIRNVEALTLPPIEEISYSNYENYINNLIYYNTSLYQYIPGNLDNISNPNMLHEKFLKCKQGVDWKGSVQKYGMNELLYNTQLHNDIENNNYKPKKPDEFKLNERGHIRSIKSQNIRDRIVQKSFNDNVLLPNVRTHLIYDNGASLKGKGISFSRNRFEVHLRKAYKEFNGDFYVLIIDFSKFFDNILHQQLLNMFAPYLNQYEYNFLVSFMKEFEIDVSYMTDEEYSSSLDVLFNSLEYSDNLDKERKSKLNETKMLAKSIGIGNQISQISGLFYPHEIDNYCKIVRGIKYYGRYMDDTYIMLKSKEELKTLLKDITDICNKLGIFINHRKTKIIKSTNIIPYLKINYMFTNNGGLIRKVSKETIHREYRKITKYKNMMNTKGFKLNDIIFWYKSWRGSFIKYDSKSEIYKLDKYMIDTFFLPYKFYKKINL